MRPMPRLDLAGMKTLALALLGLMLALFALSTLLQPKHPWLGWMRAFAEAASVGAIADWFAVTALFRHPMGLPLPHTTIIPRNKDEIGRTLVHDIIEHLRTETYYRTVWEDLRRRILADIARPSSAIIAHLADTINATARIVLADEALRTRLDGWVRRGAETLLLRHRREISTLIDEVVANWDGKEISTRIETEIGPDLQYIRINGTLVGGAAGVLLHGLGLALIP